MARSRNIKPGLYANEELAECSIWARFIFPGLWMLADREGRLEDRPKRIKGELLRYDEIDIEPLLGELAQRRFISRYTVDGRQVIQVMAFNKHQNPHHREAPSRLPAPSAQGQKQADPHAAHGQAASSPVQALGSTEPSHGPAVLIPDSLIPDSKEKHAARAADAPDSVKLMTAKERVWALGPEIVGGADGGARTFLGKLVAAHGEDIVDEALGACAIEQPGQPRPWLLKSCQAKAKQRDNSPKNADLVGDDKPAWAIKAGFPNKFEASNEGCHEHNANAFRDGKRMEHA